MANAREMLDSLPNGKEEVEKDPFPTIRESLAELGTNPDKYEKILAQAGEKLHWEKVFRPKTTLEVGAITLLAAAKQSGAEPNEYLSRLAPYFDSRIQSLPDLYNASGYVSGDAPTRAVLTRTARDIKGSAYTLPHELEHTLQGIDGENFLPLYGPLGSDTKRFGAYDRNKDRLQEALSKMPVEEREQITAKHPVFGRYLSQGNELFARIRAKDMVDSAKGEDFLQTEMGQKLFPTDKDRAYFIGSTLPGVPTIAPPYDFTSTDKNKKPLTDPKTSYARQLYNKLTAPKEFQEGGEVTPPTEFAQALEALEANPEKYKSMYLYLLTKGDIANLDEKDLKQTDVAALGLMHAASLTNKEPEDFVQQLRPNMPNVPSRPADVRPSVMLQGSSGGYNTRMPGMNFDVPYVPENLMGRVGAETNVGEGQARAGVVAGAIRTPQTGVKAIPVMGDIGFNFPVGGGTFGLSATAPLNTPRAKNTNVQATFTKRFQEGGEVTDEFPEEAGAMPGQSPSEAAKRLSYYKKTTDNDTFIESTPQSNTQRAIGTLGGYMDQAGQFVSKSLEPIAEKNPVRNFLIDMFVASPLKSAGTALQDYTKTSREITEEQPYMRAPLTGSGQTLKLDPRMLDVAGFSIPAARGATKLASVGTDIAKEALPYVKNVAEKASDLYQAGKIPGMPAPNAYMAEPSIPMKVELPSSTTAKDDLAKVPKAPKALAPANEQGFYSATEAAALNLQRKSGSGQAFLNDLLKQENVRPDEINAMGLDEWLKGKKDVTAAEVQDYIAKNKIQLGETVYGGQIKEDPVGIANRKEVFDRYEPEIQELYKKINSTSVLPEQNRLMNQLNDLQLKRDAEADDVYTIPENKETKFGSYSLPGGENYREIVLTLPEQGKVMKFEDALKLWKEDARAGKRGIYTESEINAMQPDDLVDILREDYIIPSIKKSYQSSHWDEPNPLAHLRVSDRVTDGKKTLLVDEVQSDWHQAARDARTLEIKRLVNTYNVSKEDAQKAVPEDFGYKGGTVERAKDYKWDQSAQKTLGIKENDPAWVAKDRKGNVVGHYTSENAAKTQLAESTSGVPDAPYKDDWYQLTLRRAIKEAIDGGYDRVALPTGARVAERFDLSQQIDRIDYRKRSDGTYAMSAIKDGQRLFSKESLTEKELSETVGKDIANKIVGGEGSSYGFNSGTSNPTMSLKGLDLQVGGEGMKKYYDEIYPGYLKKFGKKYGAGVGKTTTPTEYARDAQGIPSMYPTQEPLFYMDITPKMREEFSTGIPMKDGGEVLKGGIGSIPTK